MQLLPQQSAKHVCKAKQKSFQLLQKLIYRRAYVQNDFKKFMLGAWLFVPLLLIINLL